MFIEQAYTGKNGQRYFWTVALTFIVVILATLPVVVLLPDVAVRYSPAGFVLTMLSFAVPLAFLGWWAPRIHTRPLLTFITTRKQLDWSRVRFAGLLWFGLALVSDLVIFSLQPDHYHWTFDIKEFVPFCILALVFVPLQTTFEEVLFRGYLMQGIGVTATYRWVPLLLTSVVFGLMHGANTELDYYGNIMMVHYIGMGLLLGVLTMLDEGLEMALGVHLSNNLYSFLLVSYEGSSLPTPAVVKWQNLDPLLMVGAWLVMAILFLGITAKRFTRQDWKKLLLGRIQRNTNTAVGAVVDESAPETLLPRSSAASAEETP